MTNDQTWRGKIGKLDDADLDDLFSGGIVARIATLDADGWPYVVPAWFEWDVNERAFWFIARERSVWARHMVADSRVALSIDDEAAPYRKVQVQGTAEIVEEPNVGGAWVPIANRMATRYLGEHGPDYLEPTLDKPRWLIRVRPVKMQTWQGVEWAKKYK